MVKAKSVTVAAIIPSFNESKNISLVIEGIRKELPNSKIVIVDDSDKVESRKTQKAISKFKNITFISRGKKMGRGSAVLDGFKIGLENKKIEYFFEIDSDLAHDTSKLPTFIQKMNDKKAGMVIGSRYVNGGKVVGVSFKRKILSRVINKFLSLMLNVKLSDYTSGYRLYSRKAVDFLTRSEIKSSGFITLSEITYKLSNNGFKITEVPVVISNRIHGKSTMGMHELTISLIFIIKMKFDEEYLKKAKKLIKQFAV